MSYIKNVAGEPEASVRIDERIASDPVERPIATPPEPAFVRRALEQADMNALRIALYHQTRDSELLDMALARFPVRGGAFEARVVARHHHDAIKQKALAFLTDPDNIRRDPPTRDEAEQLMRHFQGSELSPAALDFGYGDLGIDKKARDAEWAAKPSAERLENFDVTIVGGGISGLAIARQLGRLGLKHHILEKRDSFGGTWHINDYPEARVDISTFLYQYKFDLEYPWKSHFATQPELVEYMEYVVDKYGLRDRIELNTELQAASWNDDLSKWELTIRLPDGSTEHRLTSIVISAVGLFGTPKMPDIQGIEDFEGAMFHTTEWDHGFVPDGKRIAVIGTGSTSTQLMPSLAEKAEQLTVYQRTPSWITPVHDYHGTVSPELRWLLDTMPGYTNWHVYSLHVADLQLQEFQDLDREWIAGGGKVNERNDRLRENLIRYIREECAGRDDLYDRLVPDYAPTARRLVIDNGFYRALRRENVALDSAGIDRITRTGIVSKDGTSRDFDLIVLGAGFQVSRYLWPTSYRGRNGMTLEQLWEADGARAHLGINLPEFPNMFVIYGPNAQARSGSFHSWIEILSRYICGLITHMIETGGTSIEVRKAAFDAYNDRMDQAMTSTLWEAEGQGGYYLNEQGRSGVNMPWRIYDFYDMLRNPEMKDFTVR
ncbi:MAG: FAD-dependent oxidoreductase [Sphingopyxis sp.]|uniref:flavin-containing monooxygenase n=1 Tax=Sphingopyxis sp. TaxID=1908224 RepID=UPI002ABC4E08|nr:NAD(P)-binding domain-containing protein [Sphingopyxis sp.]MDZ3833537.1 FAD-dependent oxidoreductase [Sphingopyxis sp.]